HPDLLDDVLDLALLAGVTPRRGEHPRAVFRDQRLEARRVALQHGADMFLVASFHARGDASKQVVNPQSFSWPRAGQPARPARGGSEFEGGSSAGHQPCDRAASMTRSNSPE